MRSRELIKVVRGGNLVLPNELTEGDLVMEGDRIVQITPGGLPATFYSQADEVINAYGMYVMPGMVDMHCDAVEKEIQPRPNTRFPLQQSFYELDKKLAASGITSMYHSISLADGVGVRDNGFCTEIVDVFNELKARRSLVRHRIHLRYEITNIEGLRIVEELVEQKAIDLLSYMDHTPGQGQFAKPGAYEEYVEKTYGITGLESRMLIDQLVESQKLVNWDVLRSLAFKAKAQGIALASHDDDSAEKVDFMLECPLTISEFPVNLETAQYAGDKGLHVAVGAPNLVRGGSHSRNMRAMDAVLANAADIVCSDYHPPSMLPAVFKIVQEGIPLTKAVRLVSLNPAIALGVDREQGSLEPGKWADLLLVEMYDDYPLIHRTMVAGRTVYASEYREETQPSARSLAVEAKQA